MLRQFCVAGSARRVWLVGLTMAAALALAAQASAKDGATACTGPFGGSAQEVVVPPGATCTLEETAVIAHNVVVEPGGSLVDNGASIGASLQAKNPLGIQIGGSHQSVIGHDVHITGVVGNVAGGDNYVCNAKVGHNLQVEHASATAAPIVVGDAPDCSAGDQVSHDVHVQHNETKVDVSESTVTHDVHVEDNNDGVEVIANTIGHDLHVQNNSGGVTVSNNKAGHKAKCKNNAPTTAGEGNTQAQGRPKGCPPAPSRPEVKKLSPDQGPSAGGTVVTIKGGGFTGTMQVKFGSKEAASFKVESDGIITATSPPGTAGKAVDVTVTNPQGTSPKSSGDRFAYTH
jgi:hypothetical protein